MQQSDELFYSVIKELDKAGILQELVLIGGWCQKIYRINFGNPKGLSLLRTVDIDFLIPRSKKIKKEVDVPQILKRLGFDEIFSVLKGYTKYVHRELEVEFLRETHIDRSCNAPTRRITISALPKLNNKQLKEN